MRRTGARCKSKLPDLFEIRGIKQGFIEVLGFPHRRICWKYFPETDENAELAGVPVPKSVAPPKRIGDNFVPWTTPAKRPYYEHDLLKQMGDVIQAGDTVVIVGGGFGISSAHAAKAVGSEGRVITYEASSDAISWIGKTLDLVGVSDQIDIRHEVIGEVNSIYGDELGNPDTRQPSQLPDCNVLVMDCEGAESKILEGLTSKPREIVVETHAVYESPESMVRESLTRLDYSVVERGVENSSNGVYILTATHKQ